jgi:hypothetical protein
MGLKACPIKTKNISGSCGDDVVIVKPDCHARIHTPWPLIAQSPEAKMAPRHGVLLCLDIKKLSAGSRTDRQQPLAVSRETRYMT